LERSFRLQTYDIGMFVPNKFSTLTFLFQKLQKCNPAKFTRKEWIGRIASAWQLVWFGSLETLKPGLSSGPQFTGNYPDSLL
jgi:hypothetical protein